VDNVAKRARKRTGTVQSFTDAYGQRFFRARIRLGDRSRHWERVPNTDCAEFIAWCATQPIRVVPREPRPRAKAWASWLQAKENACGAILAAKRARLEDATAAQWIEGEGDVWFDTWRNARAAKGLTSTRDNAAHYRLHIRPAIRGRHVRYWTREDLRAIVAALDAKVAAGELSHKSAWNVWGTATKMCADAVRSKLAMLRVRSENPAKDVEGPDRGIEKAKQFLYPSEFLTFVTCAKVPLMWRQAVTVAIYVYPRDGEHRVLDFERGDVDLEHGTVHIHRAWNRRARVETSTKSERARRFSIEPNLLPLLRELHNRAGGKGPVTPLPSERDMARGLRRWLWRAGVRRPELHKGTNTTKPLTWHDLRATGLTWMAIRGDDPLKIMQRAGHEDFATSQIYIRTAEAVREGFGEVFPPLPATLFGNDDDRGDSRSTERSTRPNDAGLSRLVRGVSPRLASRSAQETRGDREPSLVRVPSAPPTFREVG
jgi:hypothetical protein